MKTSASAWFSGSAPDVGYARFYGADDDAAAGCDEEESARLLVKCWARLPPKLPKLPELVALLRRDSELDLTDAEADLLVRMSAATTDRRLALERAKMMSRGRSHT